MSEPRQVQRIGNLSSDFWQRQGDVSMLVGKDVHADDEAAVDVRGLFSRMANRYGILGYDDHFRSGMIPFGFTWINVAPFDGVPPTLDYDYRHSFLRAAGDNAANDYFLARGVTDYDGMEFVARVHVGHHARGGIRIDDGTDNNYSELILYSDDDGQQELYYRHNTGGAGAIAVLLGVFPHSEYYVLRLLRSGNNTYSYVVGEEGDPIYQLSGTTATAWVPTRVGLHFWSSNTHLFYCDWFYEDFDWIPADVPAAEATALMELYYLTAGENWTNNTNWLIDPTVNNWFGVTVAGGAVTAVSLQNNNLVGDVTTWSVDELTSLVSLNLGDNANLAGDISGWVLPATVTNFNLLGAPSPNIVGDITTWQPQAGTTLFWLGYTGVTGDVTNWVLPATLTSFNLALTPLTGDLTSWVIPAAATTFDVHESNFTGSVSSWVMPALLAYFQIQESQLSGTPDISANTAMAVYGYNDCGLTQANVDAVLQSVYDRRMAFTAAMPFLTIGKAFDTNAAPSGIYQPACPPTTGKECVFELMNDSCGDGFNKWLVWYTP